MKKSGVTLVTVPPVELYPKNVYGLRMDTTGNIHFNLNQEVIYPVEGALVFHDFTTNKQHFLRFPDETKPEIIKISPTRKILAILEVLQANEQQISIYDLTTLKKRRTLYLPSDYRDAVISLLSFTADSKGLIVLTKAPKAMLFILLLDRASTVIQAQTLSNKAELIQYVATNPYDNGLLAVCGNNLLTLLNKSEKSLNLSTNIKSNYHATTMSFISMDLLMVGTANNELILIENGELKSCIEASKAEFIELLWDQDQYNKLEYTPSDESINIKKSNSQVLHMTSFARGFFFVIHNFVFVFESVSKIKLERKAVITIPSSFHSEDTYGIVNISMDSKHETIIVTTMHAQIYISPLLPVKDLITKSKIFKFEPLGSCIHNASIIDISLCAWKPIIMTASRDQTVRIWNYETEKTELIRKFQVDVNIVELNPTGLLAAVGFVDQLRIAQIFLDELNIVKTYNFPRCKDVKYSNYGHFLAAAHDNLISITSVYKLDVLNVLKGHSGIVLSVKWTKTDRHLLSAGAEGAIYVWDVEKAVRIQEIVHKETEYRAVAVASSAEIMTLYAATNNGVLRVFQNAEIVREIAISSKTKVGLTDVCLSRSETIMFVSNEAGELYNVQLPFLDAGGGVCTKYSFFISKVNKIQFSYDGTLLVAASENGTLAIFALHNIEGKIAQIDKDLMKSREVLIPRSILREKNDQIVNLEIRLKQQAEEFQYQISQNAIFDNEHIAKVHKTYISAIETLKRENNERELAHTEKENIIAFQIKDLKKQHQKQLENLAKQYSERMLIEYQKFTNLKENIIELQTVYEGKLKATAGTLQDTVEGLETEYIKQLDERRSLTQELMAQLADKRVEFLDYCQKVEQENEQSIVRIELDYEKKLDDQRNQTKLWRGKAGVLQKKYDKIKKEIDKLLAEMEVLKYEHEKCATTISQLNRKIDYLQKDIQDHEQTLTTKEKRIQELMMKNLELDKHKQVLTHKVNELKAQIEPREFQINHKRKRINNLESELADVSHYNNQLMRQMEDLTEKYKERKTELTANRDKAISLREAVYQLYTDIYQVGLKISSSGLDVEVRQLYEKYATDKETTRAIAIEKDVQEEFDRQKDYALTALEKQKSTKIKEEEVEKRMQMYNTNLELMRKLEKLRDENNALKRKTK